jgi:hypothetical protein
MPRPDDEYDDRRDDDRDNRPRRRDDEPPPKKKGGAMPILLIIGGFLLLGCCGVCGFGTYYFMNIGLELAKKPDEFLGKVSQGDFSGAYAMTSPRFQGQLSLEQFTTAMKNAKLDKNTGVSGQPAQSQGNQELTLTAQVGLPDGKSTSVSFKFVPESPSNPFKFVMDDVSGPDIKYDGSKPKDKPKDDKPKTDEKTKPKAEDEDQ